MVFCKYTDQVKIVFVHYVATLVTPTFFTPFFRSNKYHSKGSVTTAIIMSNYSNALLALTNALVDKELVDHVGIGQLISLVESDLAEDAPREKK